MLSTQQLYSYLTVNKARLMSEYHLTKIGIFGSYARGEETEGSDIDLIVEFEDNTPNLADVKESLRAEFERQFHLPVDICREKFIKPMFRQQILSQAIYA